MSSSVLSRLRWEGQCRPRRAAGLDAQVMGIAGIQGDGEVSHTLRLASLLDYLPAVKASVEGVAQMDLQIAGTWAESVLGKPSGFSLPEVTGTVQLHNVRAIRCEERMSRLKFLRRNYG